jgi:hypothetical protein
MTRAKKVVDPAVEHQPPKCKAMSSNPSTTNKKIPQHLFIEVLFDEAMNWKPPKHPS